MILTFESSCDVILLHFIVQMAMACIGFGLSLEFGWHIADSW